MTETCWFCKKNTEDPTKIIEVPLYKVISSSNTRDGNKVSTITHYTVGEVVIHRCSECAKVHKKIRIINIMTPVGLIILFIVWTPIINTLFLSISNGNTNNPDIGLTLLFWLIPLLAPIYIVALNIIKKHLLQSLGTLPESEKKKHPEVLELRKEGYYIGEKP